MHVTFYDTKSYDREFFTAQAAGGLDLLFHDFRLNAANAASAEGEAVCVFVNDLLDRPCLEILAARGVKLAALRCAGFNNVDLAAARELGIQVVRVPAYSPNAVAEHAVALLLTLNRKIHRAYNRVRELNFSLGGLVGFDLHGKTIGIVGTGNIGRVAAKIFRGFGCEVLASVAFDQRNWVDGFESPHLYVLTQEAVREVYQDLLDSPETGLYQKSHITWIRTLMDTPRQ